jgi:hypothetical protein
LLLASLVVGSVHAQSSSDNPGSILFLPNIAYNSSTDTIIAISNTGNSVNVAHCFYLSSFPGLPVTCGETDFDIVLTRQQPTQWRVSTGRTFNFNDAFGAPGNGYDPGLIPPVPSGFAGALVCYEVMPDGSLSPLAQNRLKGEALILDTTSGDVARYNAITSAAIAPDADGFLALDDVEYARCPRPLHMSFIPDGSLDPAIEAHGAGGGLSRVNSTLAVLPCQLDFEEGLQAAGAVTFQVWDEFETRFSGSFLASCWTGLSLGSLSQFRSVLQAGSLSTLYAHAELTSSGAPVLAVLDSLHRDGQSVVARASINLHGEPGSVDSAVTVPW